MFKKLFSKYYCLLGLFPLMLLFTTGDPYSFTAPILLFGLGGVFFFGNSNLLTRLAFIGVMVDSVIIFFAIKSLPSLILPANIGGLKITLILMAIFSILSPLLMGLYFLKRDGFRAFTNFLFMLLLVYIFYSLLQFEGEMRKLGAEIGIICFCYGIWLLLLAISIGAKVELKIVEDSQNVKSGREV